MTLSIHRTVLQVFIAASLVVVLAAGCGGPSRYTPAATSRAAGTDAALSVEPDADQHTAEIELVVEHLAPPARIRPNATSFVVWARQGTTGRWTRVGVLVYDAEQRIGNISATVPFEQFNLSVTAEAQPTATQPSPQVVLTQRVQ